MRLLSIAPAVRNTVLTALLLSGALWALTTWRRMECESLLGSMSKYNYAIRSYRNHSFLDTIDISGEIAISEDRFAAMCRDLGMIKVKWSRWLERVNNTPYSQEFQTLVPTDTIYLADHRDGGNIRLTWLRNGRAAFWYSQTY